MRYVGGLDADGKSAIVKRSLPPRVWAYADSAVEAPHFLPRKLVAAPDGLPAPHTATLAELWTIKTSDQAVIFEDPGDYSFEPGQASLEVPEGVVRWCVASFGPGYASKMHHTDSIDLNTVLSGELTLVLEAEAILLRPGDSVLVPGLEHSWRTETGASFVFCMLSPHPGSARL
jgi:mannose-6-phosphate isomerase-like protein (cupin superfamily)